MSSPAAIESISRLTLHLLLLTLHLLLGPALIPILRDELLHVFMRPHGMFMRPLRQLVGGQMVTFVVCGRGSVVGVGGKVV